MSSSVRVIGIGNMFRHDDAAGLLVAREVKRRAPDLTVAEHRGDGTALIQNWNKFDRVILLDAIQSGGKPGEVRGIDALSAPIPSAYFCCSTHAFNVAEAVELARVLDLLPERLELIGIEGKDFSPGEGLSTELAEAIDVAASRVLDAARAMKGSDPCTNFPSSTA